jgi:UDP-2-acetamido-3-amino-2,3-dideoxy-glucuronate N-acetyltransferase
MGVVNIFCYLREFRSKKWQKNPFMRIPSAVIDDGCVVGAGSKDVAFLPCHRRVRPYWRRLFARSERVCCFGRSALGDNVKVQNNVSIYTGVVCEDDVFLGPSMVFTNVFNPRSARGTGKTNTKRQPMSPRGASRSARMPRSCAARGIGAFCLYRRRGGGHEGCAGLCPAGGQPRRGRPAG